jgi:capsid assembly protease
MSKLKLDSHILFQLYSANWAIMPSMYETMQSIANREPFDFEAVAAKRGKTLSRSGVATIREGIATIDIIGPIFTRADFFTEICGATDINTLARSIQEAVSSPEVKAIILSIDSPGGEVSGTSELASLIYSSRKIKPIYAFAQGLCASGAYWIGSAASKLYGADTSQFGSIGVVGAYKRRNTEGTEVVEIVSAVSPFKRVSAFEDKGKEKIQATVDTLGEVFVQHVAKYRNLSVEKVLADFGEGWVRVGADAVTHGMADGLSTYENLHSILSSQTKGAFMEPNTVRQDSGTTASQITEADLKAQYEKGIAAGIANETQRIQGIEALNTKGHEVLVSQYKFDGKTSADQIAGMILREKSETTASRTEALNKDNKELLSTVLGATAPSPKSKEQSEGNRFTKHIVAGANAEIQRSVKSF